MIHALKLHPEYFEDVISGKKSFEVRKNDRAFHKGDLLALNEYSEELKCYSGRSCLVYIDYILNDADFCKKDMVVLGIKPCLVERIDAPRYNAYERCVSYEVPLATRRDGERE